MERVEVAATKKGNEADASLPFYILIKRCDG